MALHLIIDGYNLIRQSASLGSLDDQDIQLGREALIAKLVAYRRLKPHRITVVFDGANAPHFARCQDRTKGVAICFSQNGELADAVIKRMVAQERERAVVVSSDRDVADYAEFRGAAVISATDFELKLVMACGISGKGADEGEEHTGWQPTTVKKGPRRRLSKKERRRRVKTAKL